MPREKSIGVIIYREGNGNKSQKIKSKGRVYLLLHYPGDFHHRDHWDFPKGNQRKGEGDLETAKREVWEETGIGDLIFDLGYKEKIGYFYKEKGKTIHKEVIFYLAKAKQKEIILSEEHIGYRWLDYEKAIDLLSYESSRELLEKAEKQLSH